MRLQIPGFNPRNRRSAFTMIEIALCLAIIGFALIAIIAVLPRGLSVQRENREETVIDQDAQVWMDAIRSGAQGYNDLANYVIAITNYWTDYTVTANATNQTGSGAYGYAPELNSAYPLTNGFRIIGLLSTPKYTDTKPLVPLPSLINGGRSNYVVAWVRAISGSAADKPPQKDQTILDSAFSYKMVVENAAYVPAPPVPGNSSNARVMQSLEANSHDLRLLFRWPLLPTGDTGNGRQTFRLFTGGQLTVTNDWRDTNQPLYFLQPSAYVKVQ